MDFLGSVLSFFWCSEKCICFDIELIPQVDQQDHTNYLYFTSLVKCWLAFLASNNPKYLHRWSLSLNVYRIYLLSLLIHFTPQWVIGPSNKTQYNSYGSVRLSVVCTCQYCTSKPYKCIRYKRCKLILFQWNVLSQRYLKYNGNLYTRYCTTNTVNVESKTVIICWKSKSRKYRWHQSSLVSGPVEIKCVEWFAV